MFTPAEADADIHGSRRLEVLLLHLTKKFVAIVYLNSLTCMIILPGAVANTGVQEVL